MTKEELNYLISEKIRIDKKLLVVYGKDLTEQILNAIKIADRLEQADVNKAISDYLEDGTLKPVEIVHFANGYNAALADIRGEAE